jgi:hypothetical protein
MPLIEIDALPQPAQVDTAEVTRELNRAIAAELDCRLDAVWTVWRTVSGPYTRGEDAGFAQRRDTHGPIVHLYHHRTPEEVARVVETIEQVLVRELALAPGNVFITVQPVAFDERGG